MATSPYGIESPVTPTAAVSPIVERGDQIISANSGQLTGPAPTVDVTTGVAQQADTPAPIQNQTIEATKSADKLEETLDKFGYAKGTVDKASTVKGQFGELQKDFEGGKTPAWAAGALRNANDQMAARGLGSSSMAGAATTQAAMEAALPIAQQDAQTNFQMQMANLNNEQQMLVQKNEARINSLFSDVATENATKQFNAANENQTRQFNSNLRAQVDQFNKNQVNAMTQFNAGEQNAAALFRAQMIDQRQQFNAQNRLIIDQANAAWRQKITTTNNAEQNEANRLNAQLKAGTTLAEYNNMVQARRDAINYAFTASENAASRATELLLASMDRNQIKQAAKDERKNALWETAGNLIASFLR